MTPRTAGEKEKMQLVGSELTAEAGMLAEEATRSLGFGCRRHVVEDSPNWFHHATLLVV